MKFDIKQFISIREQLVKEKAELEERLALVNDALGESTTSSAPARKSTPASPRSAQAGKRTMSPEARERIAAAQRERWAKQKGGSNSTSSAPAGGKAKKKKTMSPEAREKIAAAQRARWARAKGK